MVSSMRSYYSLDEIKIIAKSGKIQYHGRRVSVDVAELGYQLADVVRCFLALTPDQFNKTHQYGTDGPMFDEYLTSFPRPNGDGEADELYLKFALTDGSLTSILTSFHLQRFH